MSLGIPKSLKIEYARLGHGRAYMKYSEIVVCRSEKSAKRCVAATKLLFRKLKEHADLKKGMSHRDAFNVKFRRIGNKVYSTQVMHGRKDVIISALVNELSMQVVPKKKIAKDFVKEFKRKIGPKGIKEIRNESKLILKKYK